MNQTEAFALSLAICGGIATYAFLEFGPTLSLWAAFIAWAAFFHVGGDGNALKMGIGSVIFGSILGAVALHLITGTDVGGTLGLPFWGGIVVFCAAGIAVLASRVPFLAVPPVTLQALASVAAFILLADKGVENIYAASLADSAPLNIIVSMLIGYSCGAVTGKLAGMSTKADPTVDVDLTVESESGATTPVVNV